MRVNKCLLAACLTLSALGGYGRAQTFPKAKIGTVTKFSLGAAKFKPFTKQPSAEELAKAVVALYGSFDSVAATYGSDWAMADHWLVDEQGNVSDLHFLTSKCVTEFRYKKPDKSLQLTLENGKPRSSEVVNGSSEYAYSHGKKKYVSRSDLKVLKPSFISHILGLEPGGGASPSDMRLLPDTTIGKTKAYVLQFRVPFQKSNGLPPATWTLYIGQADLLPRKVVDQWDREVHPKNDAIPGDRTTIIFSGFEANSKLSDAVFTPD